MRVVQLAAYSGPYSGSFVPMLRASLLAARDRGWDPHLVLSTSVETAGYSWIAELGDVGAPITFLDPGLRLSRASPITRLIAPEGPTVLHTHFTGFDITAVLAGWRRPAVSVLWHLHSPQKADLAVRARNAIKYALVARGTYRLLCVAPDIASEVRRRGAPADRVEFFPNAIDTERFPWPDPDDRASARAALGLPPEAPIVLHFGWDWHRKGGDVFLEMIARLTTMVPELLGVTVGGGDQARDAGRALGIGNSLRVMESVADVQRLYAAADVFASPSRAEGMPFAVAEALCRGVAV